MSAAKKTKPKSAFPKGSKAACEAAGWKFVPLPSIGPNPFLPVGSPRAAASRFRFEGARGVEAIPPAGSGIEPRHFGGMGRAVAWAVGELGRVATSPPDRTPVGVDGIRLMLAAALASGAITDGSDAVPAPPDAALLAACRDAMEAKKAEDEHRSRSYPDTLPHGHLSRALDVRRTALRSLAGMQAATREGLICKARAALTAGGTNNLTGGEREELFRSVILDLIELVPTLIDARGWAIVPPTVGEPATVGRCPGPSSAR